MKKILCCLLAIFVSGLFLSTIALAEICSESDLNQIDYTCYLGEWTACNGWVRVNVDELTETTMSFDFIVFESGAYIQNAPITNNVVSSDFVKYMDNTIAPTEYYFTGNITLVLSDKGIIMYFNNTSNPNSIPHQKFELINPNFEYREKNYSAKNAIKVKVNDNYLEFDQSPIMVNHRTLVPLRAITEALGATVNWDEKTRVVTIYNDNKTVSFKVGQNIIVCDRKETILDMYPVIVNSRTLVPVRALSEAFGYIVGWDEEEQTVLINY